mmetsp:Transcript_8525/g.9652  ORF Transcript_8525/g.9652 Transcript_8525/m.9652 type:complete len:168 (+) Transcript_8525:21-524(+)
MKNKFLCCTLITWATGNCFYDLTLGIIFLLLGIIDLIVGNYAYSIAFCVLVFVIFVPRIYFAYQFQNAKYDVVSGKVYRTVRLISSIGVVLVFLVLFIYLITDEKWNGVIAQPIIVIIYAIIEFILLRGLHLHIQLEAGSDGKNKDEKNKNEKVGSQVGSSPPEEKV